MKQKNKRESLKMYGLIFLCVVIVLAVWFYVTGLKFEQIQASDRGVGELFDVFN